MKESRNTTHFYAGYAAEFLYILSDLFYIYYIKYKFKGREISKNGLQGL
jgi:hypothetical protein